MSISIPNTYVNPNVRTVGVSKLRTLNATVLRGIDKTIVIQENDKPLAVLLKYEDYLEMQEQLIAVLETQSVLSDKETNANILAGGADAKSGNTRTIEQVRESIKKGGKERE